MNKYICFLILLLSCEFCYSQFNTVRYTDSESIIINREVDEILETQASTPILIKNDTISRLDSVLSFPKLRDKISKLQKLENFSLPLNPNKLIKINSNYGYRYHPILKEQKFHNGIDLSTKRSTVYSMLPGKVTRKGYQKSYGNYVEVKHEDITIIYAHLSKIAEYFKIGDIIKAGSCLGISGSTGLSTGDHLHIGVKYKNKFVNPKALLDFIYMMYEDIKNNDSNI